MQTQMTASIPLEEDWLNQSDSGALAEALKCLISELIGWGESRDRTKPPFAIPAH